MKEKITEIIIDHLMKSPIREPELNTLTESANYLASLIESELTKPNQSVERPDEWLSMHSTDFNDTYLLSTLDRVCKIIRTKVMKQYASSQDNEIKPNQSAKEFVDSYSHRFIMDEGYGKIPLLSRGTVIEILEQYASYKTEKTK